MQIKLERIINVKIILLGIYFVITYCSVFNLIQKGLQLLLFLLLVIVYLDKIKLRTLVGVLLITSINIIGFVIAQNFNSGFWDPINFVMKYISLFQVFVLYDIYMSLEKENKDLMLKLVLFSFVITNFVSIFYNIGDPYAIRYRPENYIFIINFNQYYTLPMLISTILTSVLFEKRINLLTLLAFISSIIVMIIGNLVTGLMLGVLSSFLVFIFWISKSNRFKQVLTVVFTFLVGLFLRSSIANLIRNVSYFKFLPSLVSSKLLVAASLLEAGEISSTLITRNEYKDYAMESFKANPLFGLSYTEYRFGTISNHADWYDFLAVNGIIGIGFLFFVMVDFIIRIIRETKTETNFVSFFISLIIFIVLGFLNPNFSVEILLMTFVVSSNISSIKCEDN